MIICIHEGEKMKDISDKEVMEYVLAGQIIFAHKVIAAGLVTLDEAADLLEMDENHLLRLFDKLGLDQPDEVLTFEQMLNEASPRELYFTAEEIRSIFLSEDEDD